MCLAVPGKVILIDNDNGLMCTGKVDFGGIVKDVNFVFVPDVQIDNYVLVHAGFANFEYSLKNTHLYSPFHN